MSYLIQVSWPAETVAELRFKDAARGNQICWGAIDEMGEQLRRCRESGARVTVLASGLAEHWLEHAWLTDLANGVDGVEQTGTGAGWFEALQELTHPELISIAAISGGTSGGGAELGWACDLRIAESQATFSQPEINMGLTTGIGGTTRLAQLAGRATAAEMVLTGKPLTAQRLYELGAVNRVVAPGQALSAALELGVELAAKSPEASAALKRILAVGDENFLNAALTEEQSIFQSIVGSEQARQGMRKAQTAYDDKLK